MLILLGDNINIINKSNEDLLDSSKEVGPEVQAKKTQVLVHVLSADYKARS
jgi:hypothetical protein